MNNCWSCTGDIILQVDGADSVSTKSENSDKDTSDLDYETDDELDVDTNPYVKSPHQKVNFRNKKVLQAMSLPLVSVLNARSLYNKVNNFKLFLSELGIEVAIVSETWERQDLSLKDLLMLKDYKIHSFRRAKINASSQPGGGCAIILNEKRFEKREVDISVPHGIEACWMVLKPKRRNDKIRNFAIGAIYVSPNSKFKTATIEHIMDTIHLLRSQYDNDINFLIGGDLNRLAISRISRILDSFAPLRQIVTSATRNSAVLDIIITDLHSYYQAPDSVNPLEVDSDKVGEDSDHNTVILSPIIIGQNRQPEKKSVSVRPLTQTGVEKFTEFITSHSWKEVIEEDDIDKKVEAFHQTLRMNLNKYLPEKVIKISYLDKKWITPQLKQLNRKFKREFYRYGKSDKWRTLKNKFKRLKRKRIKRFYNDFLIDLKNTNPAKWYSMAKKIGAESSENKQLDVECLQGLSDLEAAESIAKHFSKISQEYSSICTDNLPAFLPAPEVLSVTIEDVAERIWRLKCRKSTQPIDLPSKLRKLFPWELAYPLTNIINACLATNHYPKLWKHEWVVPVEKVSNPSELKDLRKISLTSEFNLVFEGIMKDWIMSDIGPKLDKAQYGNRKGSSTEHLLVNLMDKILRMLDANKSSAVIASMVDWASAFDRQDPTLAIEKFLKLGVRESLILVLVSYLTDRNMRVRVHNSYSSTYPLPGGRSQGTLMGVIMYLVQSNDNADVVDEDMRFKFVDDLSILELILLSSWLSEFNVKQQVANDIGVDEYFISPENLKTQNYLDSIAEWTEENLMQINEKKSNYMLFSRSTTEVATRLKINNKVIDRLEEQKVLGVWITTWLDWQKNTDEIVKKSFARLSLITKLKYIGTSITDLIDVYVLFIRSLLEYCSTVWHSTLTVDQSNSIENVQKVCLKVILGNDYNGYEQALHTCGLEKLWDRRERRCLNFALKSLTHPIHHSMFPVNPQLNVQETRFKEYFHVNRAKTESYRNSAIP